MTKPGPKPRPPEDRFWSKVSVGPGCWEWTAARTNGYGTFTLADPKRMIGAHRMSWMLTQGPIPDGRLVLHRCDNKSCVRPSHLYVGSKADNAADASARGQLKGRRHSRQDGAFNNQARLTPTAVARLRRDWATGEYTADMLGAKYGVSRNAAWSAATRRTWTDA